LKAVEKQQLEIK